MIWLLTLRFKLNLFAATDPISNLIGCLWLTRPISCIFQDIRTFSYAFISLLRPHSITSKVSLLSLGSFLYYLLYVCPYRLYLRWSRPMMMLFLSVNVEKWRIWVIEDGVLWNAWSHHPHVNHHDHHHSSSEYLTKGVTIVQ